MMSEVYGTKSDDEFSESEYSAFPVDVAVNQLDATQFVTACEKAGIRVIAYLADDQRRFDVTPIDGRNWPNPLRCPIFPADPEERRTLWDGLTKLQAVA